MNVAFLLPWYADDPSGPEDDVRYLLELASGLAEAEAGRAAVKVIAFADAARSQSLPGGVRLEVLPVAFRPEQPTDLLAWELPEALADADIVHLHQPGTQTGQAGLLLARLSHKPVSLTDCGSADRDLGAALQLPSLAQCLIYPSEFTRALAPAAAHAIVLPPAVDLAFWTPAAQRGDRLLCLGPVLPEKGIDRLIAALPPGVGLDVCGPQPNRAYARHLHRLAHGKPIAFLPCPDDPERCQRYRQARALVLPTVTRDCYGVGHPVPEWTGLAAIEAMACGTPVLARDLSGLSERVQHGRTGLLFADDAQLHEQLARLAGDPSYGQEWGASARRWVQEQHDRQTMGRRLALLFRRLIEEGATGHESPCPEHPVST